MIELADVRAQVERAWNDGSLLREWLAGAERWPWGLSARAPSGPELLRRYEEVRSWIARLEEAGVTSGCLRIEYAEVRVQKLGLQSLPAKIWIEARDQAFRLIDTAAGFARFQCLVEQTRARIPALLDWVGRRPLRALENGDVWDRILDLVEWFIANPASALYLRQVDAGGIDTKFVESHLGLLGELIDELRPVAPALTLACGSPSRRRAHRLGLVSEEPSVRMRLLDPALIAHFRGVSDMALPLREFAVLDPPCSVVFITENKTNGLAFPPAASAIVVFGLGYGIEALRDAEWLGRRRLVYWGDIDTHGYHILSRCRGYWPQLESLLMDEATLAAWSRFGVQEPAESREAAYPPRLLDGERAAFTALLEDRYGFRLRVEQERIPFDGVRGAVLKVLSAMAKTEPH